MKKTLKKLIDIPFPIQFMVGCAIVAPCAFLTGHTREGILCLVGFALVPVGAVIILIRLKRVKLQDQEENK